MAYFDGTLFGVSIFEGIAGILPGNYNGMHFYGGDILLDNIRIVNRNYSDLEFSNLDLHELPIWTPEIVMLSTFEKLDLNGGNVDGLTSPLTAYDIFRKKDEDTSFLKIKTVSSDILSMKDTTVKPGVKYTYNIVPKNATELANPIEGSIQSNFYGSYLIDPVTYQAYMFDLELDFDALKSETAVTRHDGFGKYSSFSFGKRDFFTGGISAIVVDSPVMNGDFCQTTDFLLMFKNFINNGQEKILKTRKGLVLKVVTTNYSESLFSADSDIQPVKVSFEFTEVGEVDE